ncbi:peptidylprolyl isomerase [Roseobacter weihaiensis]|uniref:peptidylprolyl isomerase n=1 Tax=Roseobacter weihaiensis TaxID=2763262 RepID=UPI001D0AEA3E|nr:peptidylprolyl isomerase [Roseobacter sp. H9]
MQIHLRLLAISLFALGLSGPASAQEESTAPDADTVVATVNGEDITLGHMIAARATLDQRYDQFPPQELWNGILQQLIQQTALAQSIESLPPLIALTLENEQRSLKAGEAIERQLAEAVTEEDIQAAYDAAYGNIDPEEEFNASHILVETEEEAIAVKEEIDGGANFAATAREKSTGPSGPNGGELGWFGTGMMVPAFEAATIALEVGEVSDPVQTQFGWHIITLNDTRQAEIPALEDVRTELQNNLTTAAATEIITKAGEQAEVEMPETDALDPSILTQRDILE